MSDKVSSVLAIAPVAAPGRVGVSAQPGSGPGGSVATEATKAFQGNRAGSAPATDIVTLQSLQAEHALQAGAGQSPTASVSQAQSQAARHAAEAAARARAQVKAEAQHRQQNQEQGIQQVASTLSNYFSEVHPDVGFRVEQRSSGVVVVMVNSLDGKVLQTISGDEARALAQTLFGRSSILPQTA